MTIDELKQACQSAIDSGSQSVVLVTSSTRLFRTRGPVGELLCENKNGERVVSFDAAKVLKYLEKVDTLR